MGSLDTGLEAKGAKELSRLGFELGVGVAVLTMIAPKMAARMKMQSGMQQITAVATVQLLTVGSRY